MTIGTASPAPAVGPARNSSMNQKDSAPNAERQAFSPALPLYAAVVQTIITTPPALSAFMSTR
ncbi:MAG: hypothetical protein PSX80_13400 [bacterium]|nr:hypothetical protein [bacterium]